MVPVSVVVDDGVKGFCSALTSPAIGPDKAPATNKEAVALLRVSLIENDLLASKLLPDSDLFIKISLYLYYRVLIKMCQIDYFSLTMLVLILKSRFII